MRIPHGGGLAAIASALRRRKEAEEMKFLLYKDAIENWRWSLLAANNRIIADSGEGYHNRDDCLAVICTVKESRAAKIVDKTEGVEKS